MKKLLTISLLLLLAVFAFGERKALIMANWSYANSTLLSPANDADTMSVVLTGLGFSVSRFNNLSITEFKAVVDTFAAHIQPTDEVVVYYSGHGLNYNNVNYLIPKGTDIGKSQIFSKTGYSVSTLASKMSPAKTSVIILEASRAWAPLGSKTTTPLSFVSMAAASPKQVILFGAEPRKSVQNSSLTRSIFTSKMALYIANSEVGINAFFPQLSAELLHVTANAQKPWISGALQTDYRFNTNVLKGKWRGFTPMEIEGGGSLSW